MSFVIQLLAELVGWGIFDGMRARFAKSAAQKVTATHRVRCGLRAAEGRVYDIGTEWSTGWASVSAGRLEFSPSVGIVGDRSIEITAVRRESVPAGLLENSDRALVWQLVTPRGVLHWAVDRAAMPIAADLLVGTSSSHPR